MSEIKRIAYVSDAVFPYNKGGKETRLFEMSTRMAKLGYDVHVYSMKWWKGNDVVTENGVKFHGICGYYPLYDGQRRSIKQGILFGLACFKLLNEDFDLVDVDHMPFFPLYSVRVVSWLKRKKMIGTWNEVWGKDYWKIYLVGYKSIFASKIEEISIKLPDKIVSISPFTTAKLLKTFGVNPKKIVNLSCGYDAEKINKAKISQQKSDIIYVGRLLGHKHVDELIVAIGRLKKSNSEIICRVVGVGPEEKNLHNLVRKLGLSKNVIFHGELEKQEEVFSLMKASKVFVLPSTREGFGIVVLEANACGIPVITTNHADNASQQIAQVVIDLNSENVATAIHDLLAKKDWNKVLKKINQNMKTYAWKNIVENYVREVI